MEVLVTHQSWTHAGTHFAYIAPYKQAWRLANLD